MLGNVHSIETLGGTDGPGVRTVLFMQGCPLRCQYCHNPDTWEMGEPTTTAEEIIRKIKRYKSYYGKDGGITISGGEPFMQAKFVGKVLRLAKENDINTAVDTCGYFLNDDVKIALKYTDLVILDIKHTNNADYKNLTGADISHSIKFLNYLKETQKPVWIRQVIVPGINDTDEQIFEFVRTIHGANVTKIELLPYHTLGVYKWAELGLNYSLKEVKPPSEAVMSRLNKVIDVL